MSRCWCPANGLVLESRGQQPCHPFVHLLGVDWGGLHRQPERLPRAPARVGQTERHRRGTRRATLAPPLMRHHTVGEADPEPDLAPVACVAPGQTAGTATPGRPQPPQRPLPPFRARRLDHCTQLAQTQLLDQAAGAIQAPRGLTSTRGPALSRTLTTCASYRSCGAPRRGWGLRPPFPRRDDPAPPRPGAVRPYTPAIHP